MRILGGGPSARARRAFPTSAAPGDLHPQRLGARERVRRAGPVPERRRRVGGGFGVGSCADVGAAASSGVAPRAGRARDVGGVLGPRGPTGRADRAMHAGVLPELFIRLSGARGGGAGRARPKARRRRAQRHHHRGRCAGGGGDCGGLDHAKVARAPIRLGPRDGVPVAHERFELGGDFVELFPSADGEDVRPPACSSPHQMRVAASC
mmetsp:Transcript_35260/g.106584  ORF Transcript_35260/g.106584 Transcript_35260/m.106584 type:complete len:208 (-) Transcript_35260:511-1134(-)